MRNYGMILLGIWLIAKHAMPLLNIRFQHSVTILAVLAIASGVLILMKK
jgi:hypothetical protein